MLGRLRMNIQDCIDEYEKVMGKVFLKKRSLITNDEYYDEKPLENVIKDLVARVLGDPEAKLMDESNPCKM
jgi:hypothetical protein